MYNYINNYITTKNGAIKKNLNKPKVIIIALALLGFGVLSGIIRELLGTAAWLGIIIPANVYFVIWLMINHERICVQSDKSLDEEAERLTVDSIAFRTKLYQMTKSGTTAEEAELLARIIRLQDGGKK